MKILFLLGLIVLSTGCSEKLKIVGYEKYSNIQEKIYLLEKKLNKDYYSQKIEGKPTLNYPRFEFKNKYGDDFFAFNYKERGGGSYIGYTYVKVKKKNYGVKVFVYSLNAGNMFRFQDKKREKYWIEFFKELDLTNNIEALPFKENKLAK